MFKVNNRHQNDVIDCVMSSCQGHRSGVFIDNKLILISLVNFEQANAGWGKYLCHKGLIKSLAFSYISKNLCHVSNHSYILPAFLQVLLFVYVKTRGSS